MDSVTIVVMATAGTLQVVVPKATNLTLPGVDPLLGDTKVTPLRIPRSVQLQLARSLTFGMLGDDK